MSRQIDLKKPLTDEDRQYLVDRCRTNDLFLNEQFQADDPDSLTPPDGLPAKTPQAGDSRPDATPAAVGQTDPATAAASASPVGASIGSAPASADGADDSDSDDEDIAPYTDEDAWPYTDLKDEISDRQENYADDDKIALNSKREDLIAWLEADDASKKSN